MLVIIDRVSKEGVFISTTDTVTAPDIADAFVSHVSSDRGLEFASHSAVSFESAYTSRQATTPQPTVR